MDRELLIEIGCEEIPASWLPGLTSQVALHLDARLKGHETARIATDFQRENSLPDEELDVWGHFIETEMSKPS